MSHSTVIEITTGLDKIELFHCTRRCAEHYGVAVDESRAFENDDALDFLVQCYARQWFSRPLLNACICEAQNYKEYLENSQEPIEFLTVVLRHFD